MDDLENPMNIVINRLKEREKELRCLYRVEDILSVGMRTVEETLKALLEVIPSGWQHPGVCEVSISYGDVLVSTENFRETDWMQQADLVVDNNLVGEIRICYTDLIRLVNNSQFLEEEQKLLNAIAERISACIFDRKLKMAIDFLKSKTLKGMPADISEMFTTMDDIHWKWRLRMTLSLAEKTDLEKYGIRGMYLVGSTKDATAGPASDIDLLIFIKNDVQKQLMLQEWIDGWGNGLSIYNQARTGYKIDKLFHLHLVDIEDIGRMQEYIEVIDSPYRPAILLKGSKPVLP